MKPKHRFGAGIGVFAVLGIVTAIWWGQQGALPQSYIFVMIPTCAIGAILIFGGFLRMLQASLESVAVQGQERADKRYYEIKALAERVADAVTQSTGDGRLVTSADPSDATLAQELAEMRRAITRIERLAVREGEAYLSGYMARAAEEEGRDGPPLSHDR